MKPTYLLEVCVDSVASAQAAEAGGAGRLELCSALSEGGLTPSIGMLEMVRELVQLPIFVLIRPRRGDFFYTGAEFNILKKDIEAVKSRGAQGIVVGMLQPNGSLDVARLRELVDLARPMQVTFHRAFDLCADPLKALDELLLLGIDRLLSSGQQPSAAAGASLIARLRAQAHNELVVMPGGGIDENNIQELRQKTGAIEYHASVRTRVDSLMQYRKANLAMGSVSALSEYECLQADAARIRALVARLEATL